jgi:ribosomal protein S18 acetylase RimI-like enzyme
MRLDSPGLTTDLDLLRLQGSTLTDHGDHLVVRTEDNPTFWWGNFVLVTTAARADEVDRWVARFEEEFPEAHHRAVAFALDGGDTDAWAARGWEVEGDVDLATTALPVVADAPDGIPALTAGFTLRALMSDDDWEQSAHVGADGSPEAQRDQRLVFERRRVQAQRGLVDSGRAQWFGAFDGDRLVARLGIVRLGALARYQDVVTLESHRRRGLAGALVRAAGEWAFEDPAVTRLVIVAEDGGPAIGLYQRAGFTEVARHVGVSRAPAGV